MMLPKGFPIAPQFLVALPVYNEVAYVSTVLDQVLRYATDVLVVDDGSTDGTADVLAKRTDVRVIRHTTNLGYGAALATAFQTTLAGKWAGLVTIDCDGQHQPRLIPDFIAALLNPDRPVDIVSGSRFLLPSPLDTQAPADRRRINQQITADIDQRLLLSLSDAFCGFKAYSRRALESLKIRELGYAMPLEVWAQAAAAGLEVVDEYAFGPDYAETLRRWRDDFLAQRDEVLKNGFDARFINIWEFYLAYCEAAFDEKNIDVVQYTLQKRVA